VTSLHKTVTRQRHDCDLNPGPSAPASSTLTTVLPSHHMHMCKEDSVKCVVLVLLAGSGVLHLGLARSCNNGLACITDRLVSANRLTMESNKPRPISIFFTSQFSLIFVPTRGRCERRC